MKQLMSIRRSMGLWCATLIAGFCMVPAANASLVSVIPQTPSANVGGTLSVDVVASGLRDGSAPSIGTYDFNLQYDASLLSLTDVTFGSGLDVQGLGSLQDWSVKALGLANVFELSLDPIDDLNQLQADTFRLVTLTFHADAIGATALTLLINAFGDAAGNALTPDIANAAVNVTPVPLPAAVWLLLSGLTTAGFVRRARSFRNQ